MEKLGAQGRTINSTLAIAAFTLHYNKPFPIQADPTSNITTKTSTSQVLLSEYTGHNKYIIEGMMLSAANQTDRLKNVIVELFRL